MVKYHRVFTPAAIWLEPIKVRLTLRFVLDVALLCERSNSLGALSLGSRRTRHSKVHALWHRAHDALKRLACLRLSRVESKHPAGLPDGVLAKLSSKLTKAGAPTHRV